MWLCLIFSGEALRIHRSSFSLQSRVNFEVFVVERTRTADYRRHRSYYINFADDGLWYVGIYVDM